MPLEIGVEQHVLIGDPVPQRVLPVTDQRASACRQSPLHVGDLVVIGASNSFEQFGVTQGEQPLRVERSAQQAPRRARLVIEHPADRGGQMCPVRGFGRAPQGATQAGHVVQRIGHDDGGAAAEMEQGAGSGQCIRQLPGPRGSPQEPQAAGAEGRLPLPETCAANVETCLRRSGWSHCGHWSGCRPFRTMASKRWPQWSQRYSKMGTMGPL